MKSPEVRPRNPRGEGGKLRADILNAAAGLIEDSGTPEAVTLRAVARRVGISAPSIYAHFPDRDAILLALIEQAFAELAQAVNAAIAEESDPVARLRLGCQAYLRFARERPQPYRIMFQEAHPASDLAPDGSENLGTEAFAILVDCIGQCAAAGRSSSTDPFADAAAVWVAMHGYALLNAGLPDFPWPAPEAMFDRIVLRLAGVSAP